MTIGGLLTFWLSALDMLYLRRRVETLQSLAFSLVIRPVGFLTFLVTVMHPFAPCTSQEIGTGVHSAF